jgi:hypothetical protein
MSCQLTVRSVAPLYQCLPGTSIINEPILDWEFADFTSHCGLSLSGVDCACPPLSATGFDWNPVTSVLGFTVNGVWYEIVGKEGKVAYTMSQNLNPLPHWPKYQRSDTVRAIGGWVPRRTNEESTVGDVSGDRQSGQGGSSTLKPSKKEREAEESIQ